MKFYEITVDGVPQLARTQAEAKPFGPLKIVEIDVAQQALMEHLNNLMRRTVGQSGQSEYIAPEKVEVEEPLQKTVSTVLTVPVNGPNGRCIRCGATPAGQKAMVDSMTQDALIERIQQGPDWLIANVKEALNELEVEARNSSGSQRVRRSAPPASQADEGTQAEHRSDEGRAAGGSGHAGPPRSPRI